MAQNRRLWCCQSPDGAPQTSTARGRRAQPFWSSLPRVNQIIRRAPAYGTFVPQEMSWEEFQAQRIPELMASNTKVGLNWTGRRAAGYELEPQDLVANVQQCIAELESRAK